jgi:hypothetical protein
MGHLINRDFDLLSFIRRRNLEAKTAHDLKNDSGLSSEGKPTPLPYCTFPLDLGSAPHDFAISDVASLEVGIVNLKESSFDLATFDDVHSAKVAE